MNCNKINLKMYEAYEKALNIKLFNNIVSFIIETTSVNCNSFINNLKLKNIWFERSINNNIQEEYGFKYFGELLERYEQRMGTDIKDIRAIALALGYSRELITNDMIIGTQLIDFINKIKRLSENDMYLKAALYLYDENKYYSLFEEIAFQKFNKTEDIVFALSLFYDIKNGFDLLGTQLNNLFGESKTISVIDNCGIYNWIINALYPVIKGNRRKDIELFKALILIPTCLVKEDTKIYQVLVLNGYTKEEISLLNYISIFYSSIPKSVRIGNSIVEEKIAVNFCINILNSKESYSDEIYELIYTMLSDYYNFEIKCYGYTGIKDAIINDIDIKVPKAFIKFYGKLDQKLFSFDILDNKWDIVKETMKSDNYRHLFDNYLLWNNFDNEQINARIIKYNELTGSSYLSTFNVYRYGRTSIYSKLVQNGVISLEETFDKYLIHKNTEDSIKKSNIDLEHLKEYIGNIENRKAFEFIKYFLSINNHTIRDLEKYNLSMGSLYNGYRCYYSSRPVIDIKREFLSDEEEKELINWLESYMFYRNPGYYMDFIKSMLNDEFIEKLIEKEDLRQLYFTLIEFEPELKNNTTLREKYLTKEELKEIEKQELEAKEREKLLEKQTIENEIIDKFNNIETVNFENLYKYCYSYRWQRKETPIACNLVKNYLESHIEEHNFIAEELIYFNKICNLLMEQQLITPEEIKNYILRYVKEGEKISCKQY